MNPDGTGLVQLTNEVGYEGGAFYSADGRQIVYRAFIPQNAAEMEDYRTLLAQNLVRGGRLELFVMNADGSGKRQVTTNGASNFAPFFHPNGDRIVFSSNQGDPTGRSFGIYTIGVDGTGQERITSGQSFNSFPMFSPDGRYLAFASDRGAEGPGIINVFLAEWVDVLPAAAR
jgi:Tol biopolymer transport system component